MGALIRAHDWTSAGLGPVASWPIELRALTDLLLAQAFPMVLLWGPDLIQIYNDSYRELMGVKHPAGLGQPTRECWPEVWHINAPVYARVAAGETVTFTDQLFPVTRYGAVEDAWFTLSYSPARCASGEVSGVFITVVETTARVRKEAAVAEREARDRALFESIDEGFYYARALFDDAGRCTDIFYIDENPAAVRLVGRATKGQRLSELGSYEAFWRDIFGQVARTGEAQRLERHSNADGKTYDFYAFKPSGAASDEFAVLFRDTTERKRQDRAMSQAARLASFRAALADALRPLTDPARIQSEAARLLGEELDATRVLYGQVEDSEHILVREEYNRAGETRAGHYELKDFRALAPYFLSGRNFVSGDLGADPRLDEDEKAYMAGFPISALAAVSLVKGGQLVACLGVHMVDPHDWTPEEIELLEEVAERTWDAVERTRAETRLRESEARFRTMTDAVPQIMWLTDADGRIEFFNKPWYDYTGMADQPGSAAEVAAALLHPEDAERTLAVFDAARAAGTRFEVEHRIRSRDGQYRWFVARAEPERDPGTGRVMRWFGVSTDIHDRRLAEEALLKSEQRFRHIVENASDYAIFTVDERGRIDSWFTGAEKVYGWTAHEIVGQPADVTFTDEDRAAGVPAWEIGEARRNGTAPNVRWHQRKDGSRVFIDGVNTAMRDADGRITGFLKIGQDMTERRLTQERLAESEERLRLVARAGRIGSFDFDMVSGVATCSPEYLELYGLPPGSPAPDYPAWLALVHPDDRDWVERETREAVADPARQHLDYEFRVVRADTGEVCWLVARTELFRDEHGRFVRSLGAQWDVSRRRSADLALRESEERFRSFAEATDDVIWMVDTQTMKLEYLSPAYERVWGEPRDRIMTDLSHWGDSIHPDDRPPPGEGIQALLAGRHYTAEYRVLRHDGSIRYVRDTGFPIFDEAGEVRRVAGVAQDLTERREAERALADAEYRARTLMEGVPQLVWRSLSGGNWTWASTQWCEFTGTCSEDNQGKGWLQALHPDDRAAALDAWADAEEKGFEVDYRVRKRTGEYRWFHTRAAPVRDDAGRIIEWLGTSTDVDDLYRLQRHQRVLLAELQHRVRNTLGVVRSIVRRTAETSEDVEEMAAHLQGRLAAFSRVQAALTRAAEAGVDLASLVEDELLAHAARESEALTIRGPQVTLEPRAAEALSLAAHELTTNAVKYGALSAPDGRLSVRWSVEERDGRRWLDFEWRESGVTLPDGPSRRGFGLELLERSLPYEHDAVTRAEFQPTGFRFTLAMPLTPLATRH